MMSQAYIDEASREAARTAAREGTTPFMVWKQDIKCWKELLASGGLEQLPFPFIGDHIPENLELEGEQFQVDSSGMGQEGERALTVGQFIHKIEPNKAYAITSMGEFQIWMQAYVEVA